MVPVYWISLRNITTMKPKQSDSGCASSLLIIFIIFLLFAIHSKNDRIEELEKKVEQLESNQ